MPVAAAAVRAGVATMDNLGASRTVIGNAIRMMCRAKKERRGRSLRCGHRGEQLKGFVPVIPDWANDKHTIEGKKLGRGMKHFREEGAKLVPPAQKDAYEDDAYRLRVEGEAAEGDNRRTVRGRAMKGKHPQALAAVAVAALLMLCDAQAQQRTIYGPDGKVTGRVTTDSQGLTTINDASGRVRGRTSTDSQGTTTLYGADGRKAGTITQSGRK